jgi:CHASE2 domain-containing sensor protein
MPTEVPTGERRPAREPRHWLAVATLTLCGLYVAELPVLSHTRDRVYLWLQQRLHRTQKSVIVVAIDDEEYRRGEPAGRSPLDKNYLRDLLILVADADPTVIGLDVGLETIENEPRSQTTLDFLRAIDAVAENCPVVLPRTIQYCRKGSDDLCRAHDIFEGYTFNHDVTFGHTSSAADIRRIPTRVAVKNCPLEDSFALAVFRKVARDVPPALDDTIQPWPYSFFLPSTAFTPKELRRSQAGLLTIQVLRAASPAQRKQWLRHQVVLIGGVWNATPHGGMPADAHETPRGPMPGVVMHANYVQSLLWDAMRGMPRQWRIGIEVFLSLALSLLFLATHGWRRYVFVVACLALVIFLTWLFSAAIGIFFDMVVPLVFLGVHATWEEASENLRLEFCRTTPPGSRRSATTNGTSTCLNAPMAKSDDGFGSTSASCYEHDRVQHIF